MPNVGSSRCGFPLPGPSVEASGKSSSTPRSSRLWFEGRFHSLDDCHWQFEPFRKPRVILKNADLLGVIPYSRSNLTCPIFSHRAFINICALGFVQMGF